MDLTEYYQHVRCAKGKTISCAHDVEIGDYVMLAYDDFDDGNYNYDLDVVIEIVYMKHESSGEVVKVVQDEINAFEREKF